MKQICDIDLDQLELISEYVTKAKVDLPTGIIDWRSYLDTVSINMYKERKQLMGSVDDEWIMWLYNKSFENDNTNIENNLDTDKNTDAQKTKKQKGKGGRPPDPKLPEKKKRKVSNYQAGGESSYWSSETRYDSYAWKCYYPTSKEICVDKTVSTTGTSARLVRDL